MYNEYTKDNDTVQETLKQHDCGYQVTHYEDKTFNVGVPVDVKPDVKVGRIKTECCGDVQTKCKCNPDNSECELLIVQKIVVKIPVSLNIDTNVGKALIECDRHDCDKECK